MNDLKTLLDAQQRLTETLEKMVEQAEKNLIDLKKLNKELEDINETKMKQVRESKIQKYGSDNQHSRCTHYEDKDGVVYKKTLSTCPGCHTHLNHEHL